MSPMKKKDINFIDFGVGLTLFFGLVAELYRFHGILLLDIWTPLFSGACLLYFLLKKNLKLPDTFFPAVCFIALGFGSLLLNSGNMTTPTFAESSFYGIRWASMYFLSVMVFNRPRKLYLQMLFVFATILAIAGFIQLKYVPDFTSFEDLGWDPHQNRLLSTWFDPNFVGGFFAFILPVSIGYALKEKSKKILPVIAIIAIALFLTYSRSSYLALLTGIIIFGFLRDFRIIIVSGVLAATLLTVSPQAQQRVGDLVDSINSVFTETYTLPDPSARLRFQTWEQAWNLFLTAPIFGHGYNAYAEASFENKTLKDSNVHSANGSDSSLLNILATTGLAGFIPYISVYILLARRTFKNRKDPISLGFFAGLCGLFVHSVFLNSLLFPLIMAPFWIATETYKKN